jgi:hypothetical protein
MSSPVTDSSKGGVGGEGGEGKEKGGEVMGDERDFNNVPSLLFRFALEEEEAVVLVLEVSLKDDGEGEGEKERASGSEGFLDLFRGSRTFLERCILTSVSEPEAMSGSERGGKETGPRPTRWSGGLYFKEATTVEHGRHGREKT